DRSLARSIALEKRFDVTSCLSQRLPQPVPLCRALGEGGFGLAHEAPASCLAAMISTRRITSKSSLLCLVDALFVRKLPLQLGDAGAEGGVLRVTSLCKMPNGIYLACLSCHHS